MKALVIYGTRWGGTIKIAQKIGQALKNEGYTIDVFDAKKCPTKIVAYDLVVIGSGIRADQWTNEALHFLEANASLLKTKKTALFVSCQMADRKEIEVYEKAKKKYLNEIADKYGLNPVSFGFFGGFMDFKQSHGLFVDILVRVNRKSLLRNGLDTHKVHDTRDWHLIEIWTREITRLAN